MSNENKKKPTQQNSQQPGNVSSLPVRCPVPDCGKKIVRAHFCEQHFDWFKEGLVTKTGQFAKDFDQKYQSYLRRQKKAA